MSVKKKKTPPLTYVDDEDQPQTRPPFRHEDAMLRARGIGIVVAALLEAPIDIRQALGTLVTRMNPLDFNGYGKVLQAAFGRCEELRGAQERSAAGSGGTA